MGANDKLAATFHPNTAPTPCVCGCPKHQGTCRCGCSYYEPDTGRADQCHCPACQPRSVYHQDRAEHHTITSGGGQ